MGKGRVACKMEPWNQAIIATATHGMEEWAMSNALIMNARRWEMHYLRKVLRKTYRYSADVKETMNKSTIAIDRVRENMGLPHIEHVILRGYFKGLYKQEKWRDINGNSLLRDIRGHKDRMWWQGVRGETHAKRRKQEGCTRGGRGRPVEH